MDQMAQSAGMTREAYEKMLTPSEQMQIAMNQLKNAGMDLAVSFTPYFKAMSMRVKELVSCAYTGTENADRPGGFWHRDLPALRFHPGAGAGGRR